MAIWDNLGKGPELSESEKAQLRKFAKMAQAREEAKNPKPVQEASSKSRKVLGCFVIILFFLILLLMGHASKDFSPWQFR